MKQKLIVHMGIYFIFFICGQTMAQSHHPFIARVAELSRQRAIVSIDHPYDSDLYVQVETESALCLNNGQKITHSDHLIPLTGNQPFRRSGEVYNMDVSKLYLTQHGIRSRVRIFRNKKGQATKPSSTIKLSYNGKNLNDAYQDTLHSIKNSAAYQTKSELGLYYRWQNHFCAKHNLCDAFLNSAVMSVKYAPNKTWISAQQTQDWKNTLIASQKKSPDQRFLSFAQLNSNIPFSELQMNLLESEISRNDLTVSIHPDDFGIHSAFGLQRLSVQDKNNAALIVLDIDQRKPFFPFKKETVFEISYKIKANKHTVSPETLYHILDLAIDYHSKGKLKACGVTESFQEYLLKQP